MADHQHAPERSAGVLLHPTSLPGPYGIGDLGPAAYGWIDALIHARQKWWQILPLGPTGFGDSPYQCFSAFAGNPLLISPQFLVQDGILNHGDLECVRFPASAIEYGPVLAFKNRILARAWEMFQAGRGGGLRSAFDDFVRQQAHWLEDYALFMALKEAQAGKSWQDWPANLRRREPAALTQAKRDLAHSIGSHKFRQFLFQRQWQGVRNYARQRGVRVIGDIPIFVSGDSADVWANPQLFMLDADRKPTVVAGVPPDYFSATGQLWGNPLYNWQALAATGFAWWIARLRTTLEQVDVIRLDHFRGFESYWEIPAGKPTAQEGRWVKAPGPALLKCLQQALGGLPLIAEDLGIITPDVEALRDNFGLSGMRILQFAFGGGSDNPYLPHNYARRTVAYTGTHDNDTTRGWFATTHERERDHVRRYLGRDGSDIAWDFLRIAWSSVAAYAIAPLQDVLSLDSPARMNLPGRPAGNWCWRYTSDQITPWVLDRLGEMTSIYGR
jgi:4-alpha-glucanotransferase